MHCLVYLQAETSSNMQNGSSQKWPRERCLLSTIPKDEGQTLYDVAYFLLLPLDTLLALLSFICNSLVVAAVLRTRSIQRPSMLLLCSLSMTDFTYAAFALYKNIQTFISVDICPKELRGPGEWFTYIISLVSTLGNLAVISFDRLLALSKPLWYRTSMTRSRAIKQILLVWLASAIMAAIADNVYSPKFLKFLNQSIALSWYTACSLTIICCYIGVLIASKRNRAAMGQYDGDMRAILAREKRVANTVGFILMVLCFTFIPAMLTPVILLHVGYAANDTIPLRLFYGVFVTLNGLLNPLLNYGRNNEVRMAVKKIISFQCLTGDGQNNVNRQHQINLNTLRVNGRVNDLPPSGQSPSYSQPVAITNG